MRPPAEPVPAPENGPEPLGRSGPTRVRGRVAGAGRWPWWGQVTAIYAIARLISLTIFLVVARTQGPNPWSEAQPSYGEFISFWDGQWYLRIAREGYPGTIPRDFFGVAQENQWAFYPVWPLLMRLGASIVPLPWTTTAGALAVLFGLAALLVCYKLFRCVASHRDSLWGVALVAALPISPILQVPYAESLHMLLLASSLYLLATQKYLWAMPVVTLMCLSRPAGLPFAVVVVVQIFVRWRQRKADPFKLPEVLKSLGLLIVCLAAGWAWPLIAWAYTGEMSAYTDTETAWRGGPLVLFEPWLHSAAYYLAPQWAVPGVVVLAILTLVILFGPQARRLGPQMQWWCIAYALYLAAVLHPQTSTWRLLLPLFPLALAAMTVARSRYYRIALIALSLVLQFMWVASLWHFTPQPGGGDFPP